jgi:hypothetical protein
MDRNGWEYDGEFDWTKNYSSNSTFTSSINKQKPNEPPLKPVQPNSNTLIPNPNEKIKGIKSLKVRKYEY